MKKFTAYAFLAACLLGMAACGQGKETDEEIQDGIVNKSFLYEEEGFGSDFVIHINDDGTFTYYEGGLSSYIGTGRWELEEDMLTLFDDEVSGYPFVNHFRVEQNDLVFLSEDSSNFLYVKVTDGQRFTETSDE